MCILYLILLLLLIMLLFFSLEKAAWKTMKPDYLSAWTLILAFFAISTIFVLLET